MVPRRLLRGPSRPAILPKPRAVRHDCHRRLHLLHGRFWLLGCQGRKQLHADNGEQKPIPQVNLIPNKTFL